MIIVILLNIVVAVEVLEQSNDKTSNTYITYIETTHQELTSDVTIQYP